MTDLSKLKELLGKATPGPWTYKTDAAYDVNVISAPDGYGSSKYVCATKQHDDGVMIVAAVNALPELIAEVEGLRAKVEMAIGDLRKRCDTCTYLEQDADFSQCAICCQDVEDKREGWRWRGEKEDAGNE